MNNNKGYHIGFLELYLPIYCILMFYPLEGAGSYGQAILFLYFIIYFFKHGFHGFNPPKGLIYFIIPLYPLQAIVFYLYGGFTIERLINLVMIFVYLILLGCLKVNINGLLKVYKYVAIIASVLIIVQFVQINVFGQVVYTILLLPIERPEAWYLEGIRPQGLFPEPQVYATFILPLLVKTILKKDYRLAIFLTLSIAFSTSSLGILSSAFVWLSLFVFSDSQKRHRTLYLSIFLICLAICTQLSVFDFAINKILETNFEENVRLTRGFYIYSELPTINKFLGIGVNNLDFWLEHGKLTLIDSITALMRHAGYITTMSELLVNFGLFLTIIYLGWLWNLYKNSEEKIMVVLLFVLSFGQTILFSGIWYFYMIFILNTLNSNNNCFLHKDR